MPLSHARENIKGQLKMAQTNTIYEIHIHGDVPLRKDILPAQIEESLSPLWRFVGASSLNEAAASYFHEELGLALDLSDNVLHMCWTIQGDDSFEQVLDELCQNLNEIAREAAPIEVSYLDVEGDNAEDDFQLLFIGPTPQAIVQAQRDLLVKDMIDLMERHFDASELSGVIAQVDRLFLERSHKLEKTHSPIHVLWSGVTFGNSSDTNKRRLH